MDFVFTFHALTRMHERSIGMNHVLNAVQTPHKLWRENERFFAQKQFTQRRLEVVYEKSENIIKIITVYWL